MRRALLAAALMLLAACGPTETDRTAPAPPVRAVTPTAAMGEQAFKRCFACHTIAPGARHGIGPNLHRIVGRDVAAAPGFAYSDALKAKGGVWDAAALDAWLKSPVQAVPGNRMTFAGIAEAAEREALILYLAEQR